MCPSGVRANEHSDYTEVGEFGPSRYPIIGSRGPIPPFLWSDPSRTVVIYGFIIKWSNGLFYGVGGQNGQL